MSTNNENFENRVISSGDWLKMTDCSTEDVSNVRLVRTNTNVEEEGTELNAVNLNRMFNEKQDKLSAGENIIINGNNISLKDFDYSPLCNSLVLEERTLESGELCECGAKLYEVDYVNWEMRAKNNTQYTKTDEYLADIDADKVECRAVDVSFVATDIEYTNAIGDEESHSPAILVQFEDKNNETKTINCMFNLTAKTVTIKSKNGQINTTSRMELLPIITPTQRLKLTVNRERVQAGFNYTFKCDTTSFVKEVSLSTIALNEYSCIKIGTIGCKATIKNWMMDAEF